MSSILPTIESFLSNPETALILGGSLFEHYNSYCSGDDELVEMFGHPPNPPAAILSSESHKLYNDILAFAREYESFRVLRPSDDNSDIRFIGELFQFAFAVGATLGYNLHRNPNAPPIV